MLGLEFAIRRQSPGLRRLVLASAHPGMALWNQSNMQLMQGMPEDVQQGLMKGFADRKGTGLLWIGTIPSTDVESNPSQRNL